MALAVLCELKIVFYPPQEGVILSDGIKITL
jgi:hypothetical protein